MSAGKDLYNECRTAGNIERVKGLIESDAECPKYTHVNGKTALHWGAAKGDVSIVDALLKAGAEINKAAAWGESPLYEAAAKGQVAAAEVLISAGADMNQAQTKEGYTPLIAAAIAGHTPMVEALLAAGVDKDKADKSGKTALHNVTGMSHKRFPDVIAALLAGGVNKDAQDNEGNTALHLAVNTNLPNRVLMLVKAGADKEIKNNAGETSRDRGKEYDERNIQGAYECLCALDQSGP